MTHEKTWKEHGKECRNHQTNWGSCSKKMPPDDYNYPCIIKFPDGHITRSDGGRVHDACLPNNADSLQWKELNR